MTGSVRTGLICISNFYNFVARHITQSVDKLKCIQIGHKRD